MDDVGIEPIAESFDRWTELLDLISTSFAYMDGVIDPPSSAKLLSVEALVAKARRERGFVALADRHVVGCIFADERSDEIYIGKLAVRRDWQGKGIGRRLLKAVEALARTRGKSSLTLETRIELVSNQQAFVRFGFREVERNAHPGYSRPTSITMRKDLTADF